MSSVRVEGMGRSEGRKGDIGAGPLHGGRSRRNCRPINLPLPFSGRSRGRTRSEEYHMNYAACKMGYKYGSHVNSQEGIFAITGARNRIFMAVARRSPSWSVHPAGDPGASTACDPCRGDFTGIEGWKGDRGPGGNSYLYDKGAFGASRISIC